MSTSLLYHAFGIRGYRYIRTDYHSDRLSSPSTRTPRVAAAPPAAATVALRGQVARRFRSLPIGHRPTFVVLPIPRVECQSCGLVRQVQVPFADPRRSYTSSFERYVLDLSRHMTISDVAAHLGVGWDVVKDIQKRARRRSPSPSSST